MTTVGKFVITIQSDGKDWTPEVKPVLLSRDAYSYAKLALLAAEVKTFVQNQVVVLNTDGGGQIKKLSDRIFNQDENGKLKDKDCVVPDTEKYQQPLPFEANRVTTGRFTSTKSNAEEVDREGYTMADKDFDFGLPPKGVLGEDTEDPGLTWYTYLHINGTVITKRYLSWLDYKEVGDSDLTDAVTRLYRADNSTEASKEGIRLLRCT